MSGMVNMSEVKIVANDLSKVYYSKITDTLADKPFNKAQLSSTDKLVLDNLKFEFRAGDIIGLIGRNGAGKSTLLSILAGISQKTGGDLDICGNVTAVMTLGIGLRDDLTGRENIFLDGQLQGKTHEEILEAADEIIDFSELGQFIDRPVKTYSTGMKSRLAFSMLVCISPEILLIDEALSAGDVFFAEKASKKIKEICAIGKIVIIVSHSTATIESMCNRCLWLEKGHINMDDEPAVVIQHYLKKLKEEERVQKTDATSKELVTLEHANYSIDNLLMRVIGESAASNVFYTKDSFFIEAYIKGEKANSVSVGFCIERLDGLLATHELLTLEPQQPCFMLQWKLDTLVLNQGYYQLCLELLEDGVLSSYCIYAFEVKNENMSTGGAPLLVYPAEVTLLIKDKLCLDSIEMTAG